MNHLTKKGIYPWFSIIGGLVGLALQIWLFSTADANELLCRYHFAAIASLVLLVAVVAFNIVMSRKETNFSRERLENASAPAAIGIAVSAVGFLVASFTPVGSGFLYKLLPISGVLAAIAMLYIAYNRSKGVRVNMLLYCLVVLFLIVRTMTACSLWSAEPQLMQFFFPLMACVFLLVAAYYRAELALETKHCHRYIFASQTALFCCCMSCRGSNWLFFLSAVVWLLADFPVIAVRNAGETHE